MKVDPAALSADAAYFWQVATIAEISNETVKKKTFVLAADIAMASGEVVESGHGWIAPLRWPSGRGE